jgi:hypothetical protein
MNEVARIRARQDPLVSCAATGRTPIQNAVRVEGRVLRIVLVR